MEEFLLRRVISIQDVLKKLLLIRKISTEKMISINNDVLSYLDEIDPVSELDELLKKYNPEQAPFIYSDKYEYQEYKGLETLKMAKAPQLMYLIPQVDPSTLCQSSSRSGGFRARTYSDPESDNNTISTLATSSSATQFGATSIPSMTSSGNLTFSSSCPPGSSPTSPPAQPINMPAGSSPSSNLSSSGFGSRKGRKKSIMSFRLHRKSTDSSASDSDGMQGAARSQVFADAAAAAKERSFKSRQHKNSDGTTMGGYRGSTGRQGHISVDYTDKLGTLFSSSSSSALPTISKTTYSSSNMSCTLSMSPDPFSPTSSSSPGSSPSRSLQQQQSCHQLNQLPSFSVVTRSSSVAAVPVAPPVTIPHELSSSGSGLPNNLGSEKKSTVLFGTPLKDLAFKKSSSSGGNKQIPDVLKFFLKGMFKANVQETPNVFKRGGKAPLIAAFKKELNEGTFNYNSDPYVSADVFKLWIRSLPDPLIPNSL